MIDVFQVNVISSNTSPVFFYPIFRSLPFVASYAYKIEPFPNFHLEMEF